jgi:hypothetical protein
MGLSVGKDDVMCTLPVEIGCDSIVPMVTNFPGAGLSVGPGYRFALLCSGKRLRLHAYFPRSFCPV